MKTFGVSAEPYIPFEEYSHIVVESGAVTPTMLPVLTKYKERGASLVLHLTDNTCALGADIFDAIVCSHGSVLGTQRMRHRDFRGITGYQIDDGVKYRLPKPAQKQIKNLVWFGSPEDVGSLTTLEPFFTEAGKRGLNLTVLVDDPTRVDVKGIITDIKPFDDDLTAFDMAILPCGNSWAIKTAWMSNLPTLYHDEDDLYRIIAGDSKNELCRGVEKPSDWLDFLELHYVSAEMYSTFRQNARKYVLEHDLIQHQCPKWLQVFESL